LAQIRLTTYTIWLRVQGGTLSNQEVGLWVELWVSR